MTPATFDDFAQRFTAWTEAANPKRYDSLLGDALPPVVERALDVGCGAGSLALWLASRAGEVTGLDVAPAMIDIARRRLAESPAPNATFVVGDAHAPPFAPGSFDLVVSDTALHDTDIARSLPALRTLVRRGGRVLLRDAIAEKPSRERSPLHQLAGTLRRVPGYLRRLGPAATVRVLRFEASPTWLRHRAEGAVLTPAEFTRIYSSHFPGGQVERQGWCMLMVWDA